MSAAATALVDFGSTFTKVRAVDGGGRLLAAAEHRTTIEGDVLEGLQAALSALAGEGHELGLGDVVACSSAGGGLRMGVVGLVEDLTAEAARQAALGAGARVLGVVSGGLADAGAARRLLAERPDIVLLVGGTDGGDRESLLASARALAAAAPEVPVVLAGNVEAQDEAAAVLEAAGAHVVRAPNVMPAIGELAPEPARELLRELFISHVIGGKLGGSAATLESLVRMATPDAALRGTEVLAEVLAEEGQPGGVLVVDVGGATTDVHSWAPETQRPGYKRPLLPQPDAARTVEADLGMRWNAVGIVEAAIDEGLLDEGGRAFPRIAGESSSTPLVAEALAEAAERRAADPGFLPEDEAEREIDRILAQLAIAVALRRHAGCRRVSLEPDGAVLRNDGRDLSAVPVLLGTGGVLREIGAAELERTLELAHHGREERLLPPQARAGIDRRGTITAAGLLASADPAAARALLAAEVGAFFAAPTQKEEEEDVNVAS
jgi:uncharacterized protein (TIGR01319 family)